MRSGRNRCWGTGRLPPPSAWPAFAGPSTRCWRLPSAILRAGTHLIAAVVIITATGVATLGPISFWHAGPDVLTATSPKQYALMYLAGVCNLVAFMSLVRGLQLTTALHINMLNNAGQVSLATIAGLVLFHEPCNAWLVLGVVAMIAGIFAIEVPVAEEAVDAPV